MVTCCVYKFACEQGWILHLSTTCPVTVSNCTSYTRKDLNFHVEGTCMKIHRYNQSRHMKYRVFLYTYNAILLLAGWGLTPPLPLPPPRPCSLEPRHPAPPQGCHLLGVSHHHLTMYIHKTDGGLGRYTGNG